MSGVNTTIVSDPDGPFLKIQSPDGLVEKSISINNAGHLEVGGNPDHRLYELAFAGGTNQHVKTSNTSYTKVAMVIFRGTDNIGLPTNIKVILKQDATNSNIKIQDITNILEIAKIAQFTETGYTIKDMGVLSNLSTDEAIWEIQLKVKTGSGTAYLSSMSLEW